MKCLSIVFILRESIVNELSSLLNENSPPLYFFLNNLMRFIHPKAIIILIAIYHIPSHGLCLVGFVSAAAAAVFDLLLLLQAQKVMSALC